MIDCTLDYGVNREEFNSKEKKIISIIQDVISYLGDNPQREGLKDTPQRVVRSWREIFAGYTKNPQEILNTTFDSRGYNDIIICKDIEFYSTCEHHLQPIIGQVHIGYIPDKKIVGLSKLARLVECFGRRLQIQETMTSQIAHSIQEFLGALGVGVVIKAKHFCMCARGINKQHSHMITLSMLGILKKNEKTKQEFLNLIKI